jgi:rod shape-determining protein MreD
MATLRGWPFWLFIAFLVLLHFFLHLGIGLGATAPDLLTVAVLLAARRLHGARATLLGLLLGLLQDALSLMSFGAEAVTQAVLGFGGARARDFFVGESAIFVGIYLFVGKWGHDVIFLVLSRTGSGGEVLSRLLVQAPLAGVYAAACGSLALFLYRAVTGER